MEHDDYDPYTVPVQCQVCRWWVQFAMCRYRELADPERFVCSICTGEANVDRDWDLGFTA